MTVPIVLVTGFLGAGKTSFINGLLARSDGLKIAAIVNDFGSINIDAALLDSATEEVIGLKNGCICCSLQGDLLRTLSTVLRENTPDLIVIEASGVADPAGIVQGLMDPVLFRAASLDSVICIVDAEDLLETGERWEDPLWKAQVLGSDLIQLSKVPDDDSRVAGLVTRLGVMGRRPVMGEDGSSAEIGDLIGAATLRQSSAPLPVPAGQRFASLEWTCDTAIPLADFQSVIQLLAPVLLRAKGFLTVAGSATPHMLFQMVGRRASLMPSDREDPGCALVLIGERGRFEPDAARHMLDTIASGAGDTRR